MSPDERRVYMREYMRARRATLKNNSPINAETSEGIDGGIGDSEASDYATSTPWLVWGILGGIGLLVIGLIVATVVSDIRESKTVKPDSTEDTQGEYPSVNVPIGHTIPIPNLGQYGN